MLLHNAGNVIEVIAVKLPEPVVCAVPRLQKHGNCLWQAESSGAIQGKTDEFRGSSVEQIPWFAGLEGLASSSKILNGRHTGPAHTSHHSKCFSLPATTAVRRSSHRAHVRLQNRLHGVFIDCCTSSQQRLLLSALLLHPISTPYRDVRRRHVECLAVEQFLQRQDWIWW